MTQPSARPGLPRNHHAPHNATVPHHRCPLWLKMFIYNANFIMFSIFLDIIGTSPEILDPKKRIPNRVLIVIFSYLALAFYYWLYLKNHLHNIQKAQIVPALIIISVSFWAHLDLFWYMLRTHTGPTHVSLLMFMHSFKYGFFLIIGPAFLLFTVKLCR